MHRLVTNISAISLDDYRFNSEPDGALEITNEHSGDAGVDSTWSAARASTRRGAGTSGRRRPGTAGRCRRPRTS